MTLHLVTYNPDSGRIALLVTVSPMTLQVGPTWEFPKIRGTLVWGPNHKGPTI